MADHEHGTMDTKTQQKTFDGFMSFVTKTIVVIVAILVLMAIFAR